MQPDVSIVIVSWNGRQHLETCLAGVAAQTGVASETILVDNGSSDGTAEFVREGFPWVRLVQLPENLGFAGGNNAGVRHARGRYVALLNNDTSADPAGCARCRGRRRGHRLRAHDGAHRLHARSEVIDSAGDGLLRWGGAFKRHRGGCAWAGSGTGEVFGVCGAACLMPKAVFDELGGFDEDFFASHEDVDLSYRARLRGYRCRYVADAVVRHVGSATLGTVSPFSVFHGQRNLEWVYVKDTPASLLVRTLPGHVVYDIAAAVHFVRFGMLRRTSAPRPRRLRGCRGCSESARDSARPPRRRCRDRSTADTRWLSTKLREKRFDGHWRRGRHDPPRDRGDPRELQRRWRARAGPSIDSR